MDESTTKNNQTYLQDIISLERDRAVRLFRFLKSYAEERSKKIRKIDSYEEVLWLSNIPKEPDCECSAWYFHTGGKEQDFWIKIHRPKFKSPPKPLPSLEPWMNTREVEDSSFEMPPLKNAIIREFKNVEGEIETETLDIENFPDVKQQWENYVQDKWWAWAEEDKKLRKIQDVYKQLFSFKEKQQKLGETYEVVVGIGLLTWKTPTGQEVTRHILTAQTSVSFDPQRGVITIGPAGGGANLTLEQDMLEPNEQPNPSELAGIDSLVNDASEAIWDNTLIEPVLKGWVHSVSYHGKYEENIEKQTACTDIPTIHFAPALILRKRTEKSYIKIFKEIEQQLLESDSEIPFGVLNLIGSGSEDTLPQQWTTSDTIKDADIYFPRPYNKEQQEIVKKINSARGVLVQGPPGTGKSHTIANLICHLLSEGKRILITSQTKRALEVLHDKLPEQVRPLCVSVLGDDQVALEGLRNSVEGINTRYSYWNADTNREDTEKYKNDLERIRREEATILASLREIREKETYHHTELSKTYVGTLARIAEALRQDAPLYSWITQIPDPNIPCPLNNSEALQLLFLLRNFPKEKQDDLAKYIPSTGSLPNLTEFDGILRQKESTEKNVNETKHYHAEHSFEVLKNVSCDIRKEFVEKLNNLYVSISGILQHRQQYTQNLVEDMLADHDRWWRKLYEITLEKINKLDNKVAELSELQVSGMSNKDYLVAKYHAEELLAHFQKGKKLGLLDKTFNKTVKEAKYLYEEIRVNGSLCDNETSLSQLIEWVEMEQEFKILQKHWEKYTDPLSGTFVQMLEDYKDFIEPIEASLSLYTSVEELKILFNQIKGLKQPTWHKPDEIKELLDIAKAVEFEIQDQRSLKALKDLEELFLKLKTQSNVHPIMTELESSVKTKDREKYAYCFQKLSEIEKGRESLSSLLELQKRLSTTLPSLLNKLKETLEDTGWDARFEHFEEAWEWSKTDLLVKGYTDPDKLDFLYRSIEVQRKKRENALSHLVEAKAWHHCLTEMKENQRKRLVAWEQAVKKIGKGTGKYAEKYRREAREHMDVCREAIPAWIMPLYRVAETIAPEKEIFDVCIIDEASQSGPEALFLFYISKKIIVVGDDQQIAPDMIGVNHENIDRLREHHLRDLELKNTFSVTTSFFDYAKIHFGAPINLKEHFRCMPEIIQFSNNLCYPNKPLEPVRQFGANRLEPVLTRYVKNGYIKSKGTGAINEPEADAIVSEIVACCENPKYHNKTMGVISLLSSSKQAQLIEKKLIDALGAEEIDKRKIICGDAYDFQGDERDVIFLSMVSAPVDQNAQAIRPGPLTKDQDMRRFNVAASRAKDQLWLFHTCTTNDLSPSCLRYKLLQYCLDPKIELTTYEGKTVTENLLVEPFDSLFEQRVFLRISQRGYRVIPQYKVAGYSIDLMLYGMKGRLAVECDGDHWHGPERYEHDMGRQRDLERQGLKFWRIQESVFNRDPDSALETLWKALHEHGITPESESPEEEITQITSEAIEVDMLSPDFDDGDELEDEEEFENELETEGIGKHPTQFAPEEVEGAIILVLKDCSNYTCVKGDLDSPKQSDLTAKVCKHLGIRTRGTPRRQFGETVMKAVKSLIREGYIQEYKAKNIRLRLVKF